MLLYAWGQPKLFRRLPVLAQYLCQEREDRGQGTVPVFPEYWEDPVGQSLYAAGIRQINNTN